MTSLLLMMLSGLQCRLSRATKYGSQHKAYQHSLQGLPGVAMNQPQWPLRNLTRLETCRIVIGYLDFNGQAHAVVAFLDIRFQVNLCQVMVSPEGARIIGEGLQNPSTFFQAVHDSDNGEFWADTMGFPLDTLVVWCKATRLHAAQRSSEPLASLGSLAYLVLPPEISTQPHVFGPKLETCTHCRPTLRPTLADSNTKCAYRCSSCPDRTREAVFT